MAAVSQRNTQGPTTEPDATGLPGYGTTLRAALTNRRALIFSGVLTIVYMAVFLYLSGLLRTVGSSQFLGVDAFPHFELHLNPTGYIPYLAFQPTGGWYLEISVLQGAELAFVAFLVVLNALLSVLMWRLQRASRRDLGSSLAAIAPMAIPNGACVACGGIPAALSLVPASLFPVAGGLIAFLQFYGVPIVFTVLVLMVLAIFNLDRANQTHCKQGPLTPLIADSVLHGPS